MEFGFTTAAYVVAAVLFILSLGGLSGQESAKRAVWYGITGMALAVAATLYGPGFGLWWLSVALIAGGGAIGWVVAQRVQMTEMPQLVAAMHSLVGLAAVFIGYSQGTAPIVSYHFGADNKDELKNLLRKSAGIIAVAGVAMLASSELLAEPLAKIFVGYDAGLLALTTHGMKLYCISFILSGFNIFGSAFFTALNNGTVSAAISFLRTLLFQVVSILTLPLIIGVDGIWLAVVAAEAMALVCTGGFVVRGRKRYGYL